MSTYLQLCVKTGRESGTMAGTNITSVVNQIGRELKVVNYVADAWTQIQNLHAGWRWMRSEFPSTAVTVSGTARYTAASWSITDLAEWIPDTEAEPDNVSIYKQSTGVSDEGRIEYIDFSTWRRLYDRGTQTNARPTHWSISPDNEFCLGPIPDAVYVVNGLYRETPQVLALNGDTPNCPARFHDIIVWKAVQMLNEHDEAAVPLIVTANAKYNAFLADLRRDQLPRITIGSAPLA